MKVLNQVIVLFLLCGFSITTFGQEDELISTLDVLVDQMDLSHTNNYDHNVLHLAVMAENYNLVVYFMEKEPSLIEGQDVDGDTPFLLACLKGNMKIVDFLLETGADINDANTLGTTCLHYLAGGGHLDEIKALVERGADPTKEDENGGTPFLLSCLQGNMEIADFFLEKGVDINDTNTSGTTCLHYLAGGGHLDEIKAMVEKGADPKKEDEDGDTPMHILLMYSAVMMDNDEEAGDETEEVDWNALKEIIRDVQNQVNE